MEVKKQLQEYNRAIINIVVYLIKNFADNKKCSKYKYVISGYTIKDYGVEVKVEFDNKKLNKMNFLISYEEIEKESMKYKSESQKLIDKIMNLF